MSVGPGSGVPKGNHSRGNLSAQMSKGGGTSISGLQAAVALNIQNEEEEESKSDQSTHN